MIKNFNKFKNFNKNYLLIDCLQKQNKNILAIAKQ